VVFLAFAVPRIAGHGRGAWARIYEESPWVNPNTLGLFLVLALVVALVRLLHGERVVRHALAGLLLTTAVALNFSRSTYVAAVVVVLVVGVLLRARVGWLLVVAALLARQVPDAVSERVFYTRSSGQLDVSSATRLELWQAALDLGLAHPWAGVGLHSLGPELSARVDGEYQFAHNSLMTLVAGTGLVLAVLVVVALVRSLRRLWRRARDREQAAVQAFLALVATLVCSAFGEPLLSLVVVVPLLALVAPALSGRPRPAAGPDLPSSPRPTRTPGSGHRNDPSR
jgi:O-antigen ligase